MSNYVAVDLSKLPKRRRSRDREFIIELAKTTNDLFAQGTLDPSGSEIAAAKFTGHALVGEITDAVVKRLHLVKAVLEDDYELPVCLLNDTYYSVFRENPPKTRSDARRCVAGIGHASRATGIRMQTGDEDLIWRAAQEQGLATGAGMMKKSADRVLTAVDSGRLSPTNAGELLQEGRRRAQPTRPELETAVVKSLPG